MALKLGAEEVLDRLDPGESDAAEPLAGVIFDGSGNLFGTTAGGGNSGSGTIFRLTQSSSGKWTELVLYHFRDQNDGAHPESSLVFDPMGNIDGAATGGAFGGGTVFRLKDQSDGWTLGVLYAFSGPPDGSYPASNLIFGRAGNVYGTTQQSGNMGQNCGHDGCGTVFELRP